MNSTICLLICLAIILPLCAALQNAPCTFTDGANYYDLNAITKPHGTATFANHYNSYYYADSNGQQYFVNVCAPTQAVCDVGAGGCQNFGTNNASIGVANAIVKPYTNPANPAIKPKYGVSLEYGSGTICGSGISRTTTISLVCNADAKETKIVNVVEYVACKYSITIESAQACPKTKKAKSFPTFSSEVFVAGTYTPDNYDYDNSNDNPLFYSISGVAQFSWDSANQASLLSGTQSLPTKGKPFGNLSLFSQRMGITKADTLDCMFTNYRKGMPQIIDTLKFNRTGTYIYMKFNAGSSVSVNKYQAGSGNDDDDNVMLMTDAETGAYVWADARLFAARYTGYTSFYNPRQTSWIEFNPASWSTAAIPSSTFAIPASWGCAKKK